MDGNTIVQVTTIIVGGIVAVVTLLVRADVRSLKLEVGTLRETVASAHALLLQQNEIIHNLTEKPIDPVEKIPRKVEQSYQASPPYRKRE